MTTSQSDAAALDRIGREIVTDHFGLTRQNLYHWRKRGVPPSYRKAVVLLGESHGHDMSDFAVEDVAA